MRGRFNRTICDTTTGIIVPFARVEVFEQVSGDKPDLFSVETGGLPISNPMTATSLGFAGFFLDPGQYRFVASTAGGTIVSEITHEIVVDPNANDGIFENIVAETFRGREIILEDISYGRVLVRDIADNTHYAEFKYEAPGNRATLSRTGYIHFDMSPGYVGVYDQVGAPILRGETTRTRLYRGGAEIFDLTSNLLKLGFSASLSILDADIAASSVRVKNPNGTCPLSSAGGTLSLERPDGVDVLVSNSGVTNLASYNGGNLLTSTSSITALYSPDGSVAFDASSAATVMRYASGNPFITAGGALGLQYENGANLLIAGTPAMVLCNPSGSGVFSATASSTSISSPSATVLSATSTTTTINAGNGTQAIAISSSGGVVAQDYFGQKYSREHQWNWTHDGTLYAAVDIIIDSTFGWGELEINLIGDYSSINNAGYIKKVQQVGFSTSSDFRVGNIVSEYNAVGAIAARYHISDLYYSATRGAWVSTITTLYSALSNAVVIKAKLTLQASQVNQALRGLTLSSTYTGTVKAAYPTGLSVPSLQADSATIVGNATAANFYGNGFNLTQLNASAVVNGTLPSNIFPSTIYTNTLHNISDSTITLQSSHLTGIDITLKSSDGTLQGAVTAGYGEVGKIGFVNGGAYRLWINADGSSQASGSFTAPNFYGNGYGLTQLNASNMPNGTLNSNIFPATISAASITFAGAHIAKGGTAYNLLDITSAASILRDSSGFDVFNASTTALSLKRANNIVLSASSTATQVFNHAGLVRANFDASNTQIFSPATVPFISATTTTAAITSGNGAACLSIDSTGAGLMRFPVFTVATKPNEAANIDRVVIFSNASLGRGLYISDGTNWRSAQSGTILS